MKPILKAYRCVDDSKIETTYLAETASGDNLTIKEVERYSRKREKELLNQIKEQMLSDMNDYVPMYLNNEIALQNLMNGVAMTAMSVVESNCIAGTITALSSLSLAKSYLKRYKKLIELEKFMYFYANEEKFNQFSSEYNYVGKDKSINYKLSELYLNNEKLDYHNINKFTRKQLKKINEIANSN